MKSNGLKAQPDWRGMLFSCVECVECVSSIPVAYAKKTATYAKLSADYFFLSADYEKLSCRPDTRFKAEKSLQG